MNTMNYGIFADMLEDLSDRDLKMIAKGLRKTIKIELYDGGFTNQLVLKLAYCDAEIKKRELARVADKKINGNKSFGFFTDAVDYLTLAYLLLLLIILCMYLMK